MKGKVEHIPLSLENWNNNANVMRWLKESHVSVSCIELYWR